MQINSLEVRAGADWTQWNVWEWEQQWDFHSRMSWDEEINWP
jgi:hypothetical protein